MSYFKSKKFPLSFLLLWSSSSSSCSSSLSLGSKGWRSGESTRLPPVWPGFKSPRRRHMWVEFVVGSLLCSMRFFSRYSGFPLSSKINISKLQFDQESGRRRTTLWMCYLQIIIYLLLFIYYSFIFHHHHYCSQHQNLSNLPSNVASPVTAPAVASIVCLFLGLPSKTVQGKKKKPCWMHKLLFTRLAKYLYRVHCILQKHSVLYDCMRKQIKVPSK